MTIRAGLYIDGFNLYHPIDELQKPYLKWLDMTALGNLLIPSKTEDLVRVVWCSAVKPGDVPKMLRHREYIRVLQGTGVHVLQGDFIHEDRNCKDCGRQWKAPVEKQSDVNLAITLIDDAHTNTIDHAYLITSDSDQAAACALYRARFPEKLLTTICPPGRSHSQEILKHATGKIALTEKHLERCLFPKTVIVNGAVVGNRDPSYDPPSGLNTSQKIVLAPRKSKV